MAHRRNKTTKFLGQEQFMYRIPSVNYAYAFQLETKSASYWMKTAVCFHFLLSKNCSSLHQWCTNCPFSSLLQHFKNLVRLTVETNEQWDSHTFKILVSTSVWKLSSLFRTHNVKNKEYRLITFWTFRKFKNRDDSRSE